MFAKDSPLCCSLPSRAGGMHVWGWRTYGCPLASAQGTLLCWMASSGFEPGTHLSPHCWLIFAWGSFTHFTRRRWKGGFLAVAGKSEAGWLPAGPASVTFGAQLAAGAPDRAARRYGGLALAVSGALSQEPPSPAASYTLGT